MKSSTRLGMVFLVSALSSFSLLDHLYPENTPFPILALSVPFLAPQSVSMAGTASTPHALLRTGDFKPVIELAPRIDDVREEVRKNPEITPPSLLLFASTMGKRFQIAILSQKNALGFLEELDSCLDNGKPIATTAKALCLREGERLARLYPVLQGNFDALELKAAPEVRNLAFHKSRN